MMLFEDISFPLDEAFLQILGIFFFAVTFSRMDPEGKLLMGFRKASHTPIIQVMKSLNRQNNFNIQNKLT